MRGNGSGTGGGSFSAGQTCAANIDKSQYLKDSRIRTTLEVWISLGLLQQPDANRLYVVYVEDNVAVQNDSYWDSKLGRYETSTQDFLGYHTAFAGTDMWGRAQDIHYAIVTYPGGTNTNVYLLSALNDMTEVTSHELAEAITDPNVGYKRIGWYDDNLH